MTCSATHTFTQAELDLARRQRPAEPEQHRAAARMKHRTRQQPGYSDHAEPVDDGGEELADGEPQPAGDGDLQSTW